MFNSKYIAEITSLYTINGKCLLVVYSSIACFIIASNTLLLVSLHKTRQLKKFTYRYIIVISITDLCRANIDFPLTLISYNVIDSPCFWTIADIINGILDSFTVLMTLGMGIDRYMHIKNNKSRKRYRERRFFEIYLASSLTFSLLTNICGYVTIDKFNRHNAPYILIALSVLLSIILAFMLTINAKLLQFVNKKANGIRKLSAHKMELSYDKRASKTMGYISISLCITYTPVILKNFIIAAYYLMQLGENKNVYLLHVWLAIPWNLYAAINSIIFILRSKKLRHFYCLSNSRNTDKKIKSRRTNTISKCTTST